ncbi:MAG: sulfotransferase domain-containing protein [Prolixibacteraceae bacterium]|nr:sulfotransferase domain-containing protein [Prolixibacteraceae bacterium]
MIQTGLKKNIVWLASYPKSGNTWFRMFLANYLKNAMEPVPLDEIESTPIASGISDFEYNTGLNPFEMTPDEVDLYRPDIYRYVSMSADNEGENLVFKKTHDAYTLNGNGEALFPSEISMGALYFIRNPLDVCVSYANHSAGEIENTLNFLMNEDAFLAGKKRGQLRQILMSWKSHVKSWQQQTQIPVHILKYEDMLQNPLETFGSAVRFLKLEYDEEKLERAIRNSDFKYLQQMEKEKGFSEKMQLCNSFFWKGKIGNYRDFLSPEGVQKIVEYNFEVMKEFGYIDMNNNLTV